MTNIKQTVRQAKEWLCRGGGQFTATQFGRDLMLDPHTRDMLLEDFCKEGLIEQSGNRRGNYVIVNTECRVMDLDNAKMDYEPVYLSLGLSDMCGVMKKNVVILGGAPNSGKTALAFDMCFNNLKCNGGAYDQVHYFNSEMIDGEMKKRRDAYNHLSHKWQGFIPYERTSNFGPVIVPDGLNIIDYLEIEGDQYHMAGTMVKQIWERLTTGIAIVFMQKNAGSGHIRGGHQIGDKPRLVVQLDWESGYTIAKITKCKLPKLAYNPQGQECDFTIERGSVVTNCTGWRWVDDKARKDLNSIYASVRASENNG